MVFTWTHCFHGVLNHESEVLASVNFPAFCRQVYKPRVLSRRNLEYSRIDSSLLQKWSSSRTLNR